MFVVLFVVGFLMTTDTPDGNASNREWLKYFRDSGNRRMQVIGALIFAVAVLAFLLFLGVLRERIRNETQTVRNVILAVAFSKTNLSDE